MLHRLPCVDRPLQPVGQRTLPIPALSIRTPIAGGRLRRPRGGAWKAAAGNQVIERQRELRHLGPNPQDGICAPAQLLSETSRGEGRYRRIVGRTMHVDILPWRGIYVQDDVQRQSGCLHDPWTPRSGTRIRTAKVQGKPLPGKTAVCAVARQQFDRLLPTNFEILTHYCETKHTNCGT